jgi:F0F1-type ATP synthase assembly protein I
MTHVQLLVILTVLGFALGVLAILGICAAAMAGYQDDQEEEQR